MAELWIGQAHTLVISIPGQLPARMPAKYYLLTILFQSL
ncbi:hypothetical protein Q673_13930 [Marinobacter sp. EN3]|nr:hypothetical protein Q673_13930 [Marinobacter sp. EN3]